MKLILLGAPGAGKGTQAEIISKKLNIPTISTGNILRAAVKNGTPVGLKAKEYMDAGKLVPDEVIIGVITERLLEAAGIHFDHVVSLEVSDEEVEQRMTGRRTCVACGATYHVVANPPKKEGICDLCGKELTIRKDDKPETVKDRLATYHAETEPLKGFYEARGILSSVENKGSIDATNAAVMEVLTK